MAVYLILISKKAFTPLYILQGLLYYKDYCTAEMDVYPPVIDIHLLNNNGNFTCNRKN
jgi:hypothetical protein